MLVLSRREDQKILFPSLGITVEVIGIRGRNVKLGVDAPPSIRIIREELRDQYHDDGEEASEMEWDFDERENAETQNTSRHQLNNRLNALGLRLQIAEKLIARGDSNRGLDEIQHVLDELLNLESTACTTNHIESNQIESDSAKQRQSTVLLVEDNENERQLLATILKMANLNVVSVADGEEALKFLDDNPSPDLVLIDMQMPRLNGPQTISIIRNSKKHSDLPIYGVSGSSRSELNVPLSNRGVNRWFSKPVQANELLDSILNECETNDAFGVGFN